MTANRFAASIVIAVLAFMGSAAALLGTLHKARVDLALVKIDLHCMEADRDWWKARAGESYQQAEGWQATALRAYERRSVSIREETSTPIQRYTVTGLTTGVVERINGPARHKIDLIMSGTNILLAEWVDCAPAPAHVQAYALTPASTNAIPARMITPVTAPWWGWDATNHVWRVGTGTYQKNDGWYGR